MAVAQELNITKVARNFFITQQGLSFNLKKLEEELGVTLFKRTPHLNLTPAGETLLRAVQRIGMIEGNLKAELQEIALENKGLIKLGITSGRAMVVLPEIINEYWNVFPNVSIDIVDGVTQSFEKALLDEELDCFIGINPIPRADFLIKNLFSDDYYIVISDKLLQRYFPKEYPQCIYTFSKGVQLQRFRSIPIILPGKSSRLFIPLKMYLNKNNFVLNSRLTSNNGELRVEMAARGFGAAVATLGRLAYVRKLSKQSPNNALYIFPLNTMLDENKLQLVYNRYTFIPKYLQTFYDIVVRKYRTTFQK